jgi:23S rRNA U2552 (ribose-2'-O)-methylase RlmE/FtsJ
MNDLESYFRNNDKRLIHKWAHYFEVYDQHFSRYRNREIVILEIGVSQGGSLQMWKSYFGDNAKIYGIDVDPRCKELEEDNIKIFIGSQANPTFLQEIKAKIPPIDILIDDGGHTMNQQIISFEELYDHIKADGIYLCEDVMTSYWVTYGGGHKRSGTFLEYSKNLIDQLHAYHSQQRSLKVSEFTNSANSIHFYDGVVVIEKSKRVTPPHHEKTGKDSFDSPTAGKRPFLSRLKSHLRYKGLLHLNKLLQKLRIKGFIWR